MRNIPVSRLIACAALSASLLLAAAVLPFAALPVMLFISAPFIYLSYEYGIIISLVYCGLPLAGGVWGGFGAIMAAVCALSFIIPGVLTGYAARRLPAAGDALMAGVFLSVSGKLASALLVWAAAGVNFLVPDAAHVEAIIGAAMDAGIGGSAGGGIEEAQENIRAIAENVTMLVPYSVLLFSAAETALSLTAASGARARLGGTRFFSLPPIADWRFPKNILCVLIAAILCEFAARYGSSPEAFASASVNLSAVARTLFIVQGIAAACYFFRAKHLSKFFGAAVIICAITMPFAGDMLSVIGVIDIGFDIRSRMKGEQR